MGFTTDIVMSGRYPIGTSCHPLLVGSLVLNVVTYVEQEVKSIFPFTGLQGKI